MEPEGPSGESAQASEPSKPDDSRTLKYHLLGPSLTKAGQDKVDQSKVRIQRSTEYLITLLTEAQGFRDHI